MIVTAFLLLMLAMFVAGLWGMIRFEYDSFPYIVSKSFAFVGCNLGSVVIVIFGLLMAVK